MKILFICTGNTCRSPMAEAIAKTIFKEHEFSSAGLAAMQGSPASDGALNAMKNMNIDISSHQAKQLNFSMVDQCDFIVPMTNQHKYILISNGIPIEKIKMFKDEISDPYMMDYTVYQACAEQIKENLISLMGELNVN